MARTFRVWFFMLAGLSGTGTWAQATIHDCADCPEMVMVPAGSFQISGEGPKVSFARPFAIAITPVTQGQWQAVMGKNPSEFKSCGDTCPVENVSWEDAQIYILRLNAKTGKHYRLPSEAEWEYACRAGGQTSYCGGNDVNEVAWYDGNSGNTTHAVGTKKPNAWGIYDMTGNVWEWVQDCFHDNLKGIPVNGKAWDEGHYPMPSPQACNSRVLRGGSWHNSDQEVLNTRRSADDMSVRVHSIGLRLARSQ